MVRSSGQELDKIEMNREGLRTNGSDAQKFLGLPPNDFAVAQEFSAQIPRRVECQPDGSVGALRDVAFRISPAHVGAHPTGTHGIHRDRAAQFGRENAGDSVERRLGNPISRVAALHLRKSAHAARHVDDAGRRASPEQRTEHVRQMQRGGCLMTALVVITTAVAAAASVASSLTSPQAL